MMPSYNLDVCTGCSQKNVWVW